jgi:hypothetical protein
LLPSPQIIFLPWITDLKLIIIIKRYLQVYVFEQFAGSLWIKATLRGLMLPIPGESKSYKRLLFFVAVILCLICIWYWNPFRTANVNKAYGKLGKAIDKQGVVSHQSYRQDSSGPADIWNFNQRTGSARDNAYLEVCIIDAKTKEAIRLGRVTVSKEPTNSVIFADSVDQNGCAGMTLDPGRYIINYQVPGYHVGNNSLEIESNLDRVKKITELYRSLTVRGIVKSASLQPQPDAIVLFGKPTGSSSFYFLGTSNTNSSGEFSTELTSQLPPGYDGISVYASKPPHGIAQLGP